LPERPRHVVLDDQVDLLVAGAVAALGDLELRLDRERGGHERFQRLALGLRPVGLAERDERVTHLRSGVAVLHIFLARGQCAEHALVDVDLVHQLVGQVRVHRADVGLGVDHLMHVELDDRVIGHRVQDQPRVEQREDLRVHEDVVLAEEHHRPQHARRDARVSRISMCSVSKSARSLLR
jgi:hypothetical protein